MSEDIGFDMQTAWLRRFQADAESNLKAFALRLKEAMPDQVTILTSKGFLSSNTKVVGVTVEIGDNQYGLAIERGKLKSTIAMVVRGITLNTKTLDPREWFAKLAEETKKATDHAQALSDSLTQFMTS